MVDERREKTRGGGGEEEGRGEERAQLSDEVGHPVVDTKGMDGGAIRRRSGERDATDSPSRISPK